MVKTIDMDIIQKNTKDFYELCSDISILQKELDQMLSAIEKNSKDFENGKISKDLFKHNDIKVKRECAKMIKKINNLVDRADSLIGKIDKEIESQKVGEKKVKNSLSEIKKKIKLKKNKVASPKTTSASPENVSPEQKIDQGS